MSLARERAERDLVAYARLQVRAGLLDADELLDHLAAAVEAELPGLDGRILARAWITKARADLVEEAATWPPVTDLDRLRAAFAECVEHGVFVFEGVEQEPVSPESAESAGQAGPVRPVRGLLWFTPEQVRTAVTTGRLRVHLQHPDRRPVEAGDALLTPVAACLQRHGLAVRPADGGLEVACAWQRRP